MRFLLLLALLTILPVSRAIAEEAPTDVELEQQFVSAFSGSEKGDTPAPKTETTTETPAPKKEEKGGKAQADGAGDDDAGEDADDDGDDEAEGEEAEESHDQDDDEGDDDGTDEEDGDGADEAARAAMERAGVKLSIQGILGKVKDPELKKELEAWNAAREKDLARGITRINQTHDEERKVLRTLQAEEQFRKAKPSTYIVQMLLETPALGNEINKLLEEVGGSTTARAAHDIVVKDARESAAKALVAQDAAEQRRSARAAEVGDYAKKAATKAGMPFTLGVAHAISNAIRDNGERTGQFDVTEVEIDGVIREMAREYNNHIRAHRREARRKVVSERVNDRATAGLAVPPNKGRAPAPAAKKVAESDDAFIDDFAGRIPG